MKTAEEMINTCGNVRQGLVGDPDSPKDACYAELTMIEIDKDNLVLLMEEYAEQLKPKWISGRFYVVENYQYEEGLINQLSNGFEEFEDAIKFLNSDYNKKYHPNSFIMNSVFPLPEKPTP